MSETTSIKQKEYKVGYYSMGISAILAGIFLVLNQLGYVVLEGIYILWPIMMILLGSEIIITKLAASIGKGKLRLSPAWGVIFICTMMIGCSQVWIMLMNSTYINW